MLLLFKIILLTINLIIYPEPIFAKSIAISENRESSDKITTDNFACKECLQKNIFLPEYQNKYSRINELNDTNFNFMKKKSNRSVTLVPDNIIGFGKRNSIFRIYQLIERCHKLTNRRIRRHPADSVVSTGYDSKDLTFRSSVFGNRNC